MILHISKVSVAIRIVYFGDFEIRHFFLKKLLILEAMFLQEYPLNSSCRSRVAYSYDAPIPFTTRAAIGRSAFHSPCFWGRPMRSRRMCNARRIKLGYANNSIACLQRFCETSKPVLNCKLNYFLHQCTLLRRATRS